MRARGQSAPLPGSTSLGGGLVLLDHAGGDPAAGADREAVVFGPRPDLAAALPAGRRPRRPARRPAARLAGVLDERRELLAEGTGVLGAQVDLVVGTAEPEPHRLIRRAAIEVIVQRDGHFLSHLLPPMPAMEFAAPSRQ